MVDPDKPDTQNSSHGAASSAAHEAVHGPGDEHGHGHGHSNLLALSLASVGVVYGDIGTSPLYAFRAAMLAAGSAHNGVQRDDVIGILSLILWSLMIIVTLK